MLKPPPYPFHGVPNAKNATDDHIDDNNKKGKYVSDFAKDFYATGGGGGGGGGTVQSRTPQSPVRSATTSSGSTTGSTGSSNTTTPTKTVLKTTSGSPRSPPKAKIVSIQQNPSPPTTSYDDSNENPSSSEDGNHNDSRNHDHNNLDDSERTRKRSTVGSLGDPATLRDLEETGKWGQISTKEILCVVGIISMLVVGIIIGVTVLVLLRRSATNAATVSNGKTAGTIFSKPEQKLRFLRQALENNAVTAGMVPTLPTRVEDLPLNVEDGVSSPLLNALSWVVLYDKDNTQEWLTARFVMAVVYFANGGTAWTSSANWLTDQPVCEWEGVICRITKDEAQSYYAVQELELTALGLTGPIQPVLALLEQVRALSLNHNALTGTIPGEVFGAMSQLVFLYLQNNQLTGSIPASLRGNRVLGRCLFVCVIITCFQLVTKNTITRSLDLLSLFLAPYYTPTATLYVHGNQLTGTWPIEFCPACPESNCTRPFNEFGLNCEQTPCPVSYCCSINNCFHGK